MSIKTINPATEEVLAEYQLMSASEIETEVEKSRKAFAQWRRTSLGERARGVQSFADTLLARKEGLARLMTLEMGKPIKESIAEVEKCAASSRTLNEHFPAWMRELEYETGNGYSVSREPLGPLVAIMPWNFPLWQVVRFAVPALLNGNTILLKHAQSTWGSAEMIADMFAHAFPASTFTHLRIDHDTVSKLIADSRVRGVSLTGSRRAGVTVGRTAGENLKKCVLELGGSDAYIVLDDADLDLAATTCAKSRVINSGQSCVSAKRFIVTRRNHDAFLKKFVAKMGAFRMGDPLDPATDVGPLARVDLRDDLRKQVQRSIAQGAEQVLGGEVRPGKGYYFSPAVLSGVRPGQAAFDEELFGPAAAVIEAKDETEAFALANRSIYGLGGAIFSSDIERAQKLAQTELDTGMIAINDFVRSDALSPFGGVRDSGLGRELGKEGAFEFTNIKSIFVKR